MISGLTRRSFLKVSTCLAGSGVIFDPLSVVHANQSKEPLIAYVGTFSSPLRNMLPTQVDLPPGNGRGIHIFHVDRGTGSLSPCGVLEQSFSPDCLAINSVGTRLYATNETDERDDGNGMYSV
jgi:6-phosphogluconolactonase